MHRNFFKDILLPPLSGEDCSTPGCPPASCCMIVYPKALQFLLSYLRQPQFNMALAATCGEVEANSDPCCTEVTAPELSHAFIG